MGGGGTPLDAAPEEHPSKSPQPTVATQAKTGPACYPELDGWQANEMQCPESAREINPEAHLPTLPLPGLLQPEKRIYPPLTDNHRQPHEQEYAGRQISEEGGLVRSEQQCD